MADADTAPPTSAEPRSPPPGQAAVRVWRACEACRRKKIKCDGKQPCHNCGSRGHDCTFPEAKDHASTTRYYASTFEAQFQHMDAVSQRLEALASELTRASELLCQASAGKTRRRNGPSRVELPSRERQQGQRSLDNNEIAIRTEATLFPENDLNGVDVEESDSDSSDDEDFFGEKEDDANQAGALVTDSYGRLRFVGGAANKMLFDAAKVLSPGIHGHRPVGHSEGSGTEAIDTPNDSNFEFPLFVRGKFWPELPFLPKPEQLSRPPQYVSDLLVGLYFDKLNATFPVLFKPHFMQRYRRMLRDGASPGSGVVDNEFLLVFFAVCACASGLLPSTSEKGFPGLEYFEKALLLYYASPGQASLEIVQCLALLAMCAAGWNTLTRSWSLSGQAVRASIDIGLHLNGKFAMSAGAGPGSNRKVELLRQQIAARTWWSVYTLDRSVSICLGRPAAIDDGDCSCDLPFDMSDEDLYRECSHPMIGSTLQSRDATSPLTGFLSFARLCHIAGKIQKLGTPARLRQLKSLSPERARKYLARMSLLDRQLRRWLETLPDSIRFSANEIDRGAGADPGLVMCVIIFIVHAGSLLNLYQYFVLDPNRGMSPDSGEAMADATAQCISAARSCINAAELVRDLIPPSHYLAICIHCLTLSGVALLRMSTQPLERETIADAKRCINFLRELEPRWSGAGRSRAIIEQLLAAYYQRANGLGREQAAEEATPADSGNGPESRKRTFADVYEGSIQAVDPFSEELPWSEIVALDARDIGFTGSWGWQMNDG
ncbi:hypothetical protein GQ53DRAFT_715269 [Thozetella sp. PMI_491]|nr:hypothetical protein GQ53DRAFT_715269 [Thozetella sp. PMI_491]